ncbi:MAG: MerR family transcriptional regulator [Chloroflexi bacterium]|nr:MerR family transcriptional regulator [Chloroflexota bacterium]
MMQKLTIGQVAKQVSMHTSAIRFYEEKGLLTPALRNESGYRQYDARVVEELRLIQRAQQLGFSLSDIHTLLQGWREGNLDQQSFIDTAEARYLVLEREITGLLALQHELGLFLQDIYETSPKTAPATLLTELIDHICLNPLNRSDRKAFDRLLERVGCHLTSKSARELMHNLRHEHIHVWNEGDAYTILVVSQDPKIGEILQQFTQIASDCQVDQHNHMVSRLAHDSSGYLLSIQGEHAFIIARLFLEMDGSSSSKP